jgi:hypothetical protein
LKTVFEPEAARDLRARLERLTPATPARWGKMDVAQMLCHVTRSLRTPTGAFDAPLLPWPLRLLGRILKRRVLSEAPVPRSAPTTTAYRVVDPCDFARERAAAIEALAVMAAGPHVVTCPQHAFFGPMTPAEWGRLMYRHLDHHLT